MFCFYRLTWLVALTLLAVPIPAAAAQWETLTGVRLADTGYFDGDSFHLAAKGKNYIFRLYFVDAPETDDSYPDRVKAQAEYFGADLKRTLALGEEATNFARKFLRAGGVTVTTCWEDARGASAQPRFYAVIESAQGNLAVELVKNGLARVYGMPTPDRWPGGKPADAFVEDLERLEAEAKREKVGGWGGGTDKAAPKTDDSWPFRAKSAVPPIPPIQPNPAYKSKFPARTPAPATGAHGSLRLNLNSATAAELEALPKIGPVYARKIIEGRPWHRAEDIVSISGLTEKSLAEIIDLIYAGPIERLVENAR